MKKLYKILFIVIIALAFFTPTYGVKADIFSPATEDLEEKIKEVEESVRKYESEEKTEEEKQKEVTQDCEYIFGNPSEEGTTAYMIQKFLNYAKVLAPLLVILLSGFDFAQTALTGDADQMKKAGKKLGIRLACAAGVFLAPFLVGFIINFINNSSVDRTCNIR